MPITTILLLLLLGLGAPVAYPAQAAELTGTLQKIKETGTIVLGERDTSVPFSYMDDQQRTIGYTHDICMKLVEAIKVAIDAPNLKVETQLVTSSNRIPLMANGTVDLECSSTTNNLDRQKQVAFTNTHFLTETRYLAKKASQLARVEDLRGKPVASVGGTTNLVQLQQINADRKLGMTILSTKDVAEGLLMVETGRAVAFVAGDIILNALLSGAKDPASLMVGEEPLSKPEPYGIMLRRNDPAFKALLDRATAELYRSPEMMVIYKRWFQSPVPPKGLNYNVPLAPVLKYQFEHPSDSADPDAYKS